jgi:hypothetical protein
LNLIEGDALGVLFWHQWMGTIGPEYGEECVGSTPVTYLLMGANDRRLIEEEEEWHQEATGVLLKLGLPTLSLDVLR